MNEKRNEKSWNFREIHYIKTMETYCVSYKKYTSNENISVKKTLMKKIVLFVARKSQLLLKIKYFQMISLK